MNYGEPKVGQSFSHYRLLSKLGEGGMGVVYAAEDTELGRQVAVKFLLEGRHRRLSRARFRREARSASALSHPNIATVYDYGETEEGYPFIVMELLRGQTLFDLLEAGVPPLARSVPIICEVLEALTEAHRQGIIHRDIKPSNVVVGEHDQVKVVDFGLAKSVEDEDAILPDALGAAMPTQTLAGALLGTPLYVSPEQATGAPVDQRSDLFSAGAVLYECLAGRPAFAAPSVVEIFARVINPVPPPPPSTYNPSVPPELDRITLRALAKAADARYQSAEEFRADLSRVTVLGHSAGGDTPWRLLGSSLDSLYKRIVSRGNESGETPVVVSVGGGGTLRRRRRRVVLSAVLFVAALSMFLGARALRSRSEHYNSIAVIPFDNMTRDEGLDYLGDGLTDSLILGLSQLPDLKVISRNSVMRYKGRAADAAEVASALKVQAVLTGRLRRDGERLRVEVELTDARDGTLVWGAQYERKLTDIMTVQQEIAREIAGRLRRKSDSGSADTSPGRRQADPAAYVLYLKGRWHWNRMTADGMRQAIAYYQQAIDIDPTYALAYAGLADAYVVNSKVSPRESYMRSKAAVAKALEYDTTLGEAHATLGLIKAHYEKDWAGADSEFERAIELNNNYASAHHWYGDALLARGQYERALLEMKRAQELDPLSPIINTDVGLCYFYMRQYDQAAAHFKQMTELFPDFFPAYYHLGWVYTQKHMYAEAIEQYRKALDITKGHTMVLALLGYTYAVSGHEAEARKVLGEMEALTARQYVSPYRFAVLYAGLGEKEMAFKSLNQAYDELDVLLIYVKEMPFFDPLRDDPRFGEFLQRMGLSPN
jgi:serine/threonine-protein kinase